MPQKFANNLSLETATALTASSTTVGFINSPTLPNVSGANDFLLLTLSDGTNTEIVKIDGNPSLGAFPITRGQEGTTAQSWPLGTSAELRLTAAPLNDLSEVMESYNERFIKYPSQHQSVIYEYIGSTTRESIIPGGGTSTTAQTQDENTQRVLYGEPSTASSRISTKVVVDLNLHGTGSSTSYSSKSALAYSTELQLFKPNSYSRPYIGQATRIATYEVEYGTRAYYVDGDVRHALFNGLYVTYTTTFSSGVPFEFVNHSFYRESENRTYFFVSSFGGSALSANSNSFSLYADIFKGVSTGGYKSFTRFSDLGRLFGQYTTYHNNSVTFHLGNTNFEMDYKVKVGKRSTSAWNVSFYVRNDSPGVFIERTYHDS